MIPLLLKPYIYSVRNRWRSGFGTRSTTSRDLILACFAFCLMWAMYAGVLWLLKTVDSLSLIGYIPGSQIFSLIMLLLSIMLLGSSLAISFGAFFSADDMDLIQASPLVPRRVFLGRYAAVIIASTWMPFVFMAPLFLAFSKHFDAPLIYHLWWISSLFPFLIIPTALAVICSHLIILVLPGRRRKEASIAALIIFFIFLLGSLDIIYRLTSSAQSGKELVKIINIFSFSDALLLPSNWFAWILAPFFGESGELRNVGMKAITGTSMALFGGAYLLFVFTHTKAYSKSKSTSYAKIIPNDQLKWLSNILKSVSSSIQSALVIKDIKTLSRDITQIVQIVMLSSICILYLYNVQIFSAIEMVGNSDSAWWRALLYSGNIAIGAFVTIAIGTRFIYPSISLEGRNFWIIQTAPVTLKDLLQAKFRTWFLPVALISMIIFTVGAYAIKADILLLVVNAFISIAISYGIVGIAIGLGALFAVFDWEHPSQLSAGFGSFVFMLVGIGLILFNMLPTYLILFRFSDQLQAERPAAAFLMTAAALVAMALINFIAAKMMMRIGEKSLERRSLSVLN